MRKTLAIARARFVDRAFVAVQEHAAFFGAAEDDRSVFVQRRVVFQKTLFRKAQKAGQMLDVAIGQRNFGDAAAFGAFAAVDGRVDLVRRAAELALDKGVRFDPFPETQIFFSIFLPHAPDLDQICDHPSRLQSERMSDRLYLSCWVRGFNEASMLRHFETMLKLFPFSKLAQRGPVLRVYALEQAEPPLIEREFPLATPVGSILAAAREFVHADCCAEIDAFWDLWQLDGDWKLAPAAVSLLCLGPEFENETGDQLRIEFGNESRFLPAPGVPGSARMGQSNLRSLLHLVKDVESTLPLDRRQIWSESGANFAELLAEAVARLEVQ